MIGMKTGIESLGVVRKYACAIEIVYKSELPGQS
jgi:hypothetical protein